MSCTSPQCQMTYANMAGQGMLGDMMGQKSQSDPAAYQMQGGPYADMMSQAMPNMPAAQTSPTAPTGQLSPITPTTQPPAMTLESTQYLNGALRTLIGRKVTVNFLIGTNTFVDKSGTLIAVGANYIVLKEIVTGNITFCDYYTIKFVTVYPE